MSHHHMFSKPVITLLDSELGCLCQESPEFLFTESQDENLFLHMETAISGQLTQWLYISSFQLLSHVHLFAAPWTAARQASLYITSSQSLLKLMFIELVVSSNHFILCCPLLLLPSIAPSIRVFSNESVLHIRWPSYWSFSFSISPSNEY